jgi:hypothetical protein
MPIKLMIAPLALYKKVDKVPLKKVERVRRTMIMVTTSLKGKVKRAIQVIIFASPSLAPGAKRKGEGILRSRTLIITAWAANKAI